MLERNLKKLAMFNAALDVLLALCSLPLAAVVFFGIAYPNSLESYLNAYLFSMRLWGVILLFGVAVAATCALLGTYHIQKRISLGGKIARLTFANVLWALVFASLLYVSRLVDFSRPFLVTFCLFFEIFMVAHAALLQAALRRLRSQGRLQRSVLLVGTGPLASRIREELESDPLLEHVIVGQITASGDIDGFLKTSTASECMLALEASELALLPGLVRTADHYGVRVRIVPVYSSLTTSNLSMDRLGHTDIISIRSVPLEDIANAAIKRTGDIVFSALILIVLCWLLAIAALGVKLSSPGPVLFKQERIGKGGKPFTMYKFRSMPVETDDSQAWSTNEDSRKTRFGSFIRKFSIDELPQFWNVLKGDMSVVGPRPEIPFFVEQFTDEHEAYMVRHQVRPGITGLAQVNGLRGDTSIADRLSEDIRYVENWTPSLDCKIIARTIFGGFVNGEKLI